MQRIQAVFPVGKKGDKL